MPLNHSNHFAARLLLLGASGVFLAIVSAPAGPAFAKTLAKVNGVEITSEDVAFAADELGPRIPPQIQGKMREAFLVKMLIGRQLAAQSAEAQKVSSGADFAKRFAYLKDKALFDTVMGGIASNAASEAAIQAAYDEYSEQQKREFEYHVRAIDFASEDDATSALKRIKGGEDFAKLAAEYAKDGGPEGGDAGWMSKEYFSALFGEPILKLDPGQLSDLLKTSDKWSIVKLEEKRPRTAPSLDLIKTQIQRQVEQKAQADFVARLRESAKIEEEQTPAPKRPAGSSPSGSMPTQ